MTLQPELATFAFHGLILPEPNSTGQCVTDCPFCGKEQHFFVSNKKDNAGQFHCKKCDVEGNRYTFLHLYYEHRLKETVDNHYKKLAKSRGTKFWIAFKNDQWAYDDIADRWLVPIFNAEGSIVNLKVYLGPTHKQKWQNTSGCSLHFYGMEQLTPEGPIFICEGEADKTMLQFHFSDVDGREHASFLGVPGKGNMSACIKRVPKNTFHNRDIVLLFDSGDTASKKQHEAAILLSREFHAKSVLCLHWPDSYPENHDITNLIDAKGPSDAWAKILSWLRPYNHRTTTDAPPKTITLAGVIQQFRDSKVHVNRGFEDVLTTVLATVASIRYGGIPLWLYVVDPPGYGKSLILEATIQSPICQFQTDMKYATLVSGFKCDPDPSLMAKINNRVLIVKDYTVILDKNEQDQKDLLGLLRDAYDGQVVRQFGNGVLRVYPEPGSGEDRCYFGLVCGVTPRIHTYNKAALGERFLKCSIGRPPISSTDIARRAIEGANDPSREVLNANRRAEAVANFLEYLPAKDKPPSIGKYIDRIIALAGFTAVCRTRPERDRQTGDLLYDADAESSSRLCKQYTKLLQSIAVVKGLPSIDDECLRILTKVVWVTSFGWHRNVYKAVWDLAPGTPSTQEIAARVNMSISGTKRALQDLLDLRVIEKCGKKPSPKVTGGKPADQYRLTEHGAELITKGKLFQRAK